MHAVFLLRSRKPAMSRIRETFLMLLLALSLLGCASEGKPVLYGERRLTTNIDTNDKQLDDLALRIGERIRQGKPGVEYVLEYRLIPQP